MFSSVFNQLTFLISLSNSGRPPGPEMDDSSDRESYCLSAGLALGMVCLGQGEKVLATDGRKSYFESRPASSLADSLYHYIVGGNKRPLTGSFLVCDCVFVERCYLN